MAGEDYNSLLDSNVTYLSYQTTLPSQSTNIAGITTTGAVTTINSDAGGSTSGPTISITGGTTGLIFTTGGASVTLSGTLAVAHGGTGAVTVAGALAALGLSKNNTAAIAPTVADDSSAGYSINSLWTNTAGPASYICQSAALGAAVWHLIP